MLSPRLLCLAALLLAAPNVRAQTPPAVAAPSWKTLQAAYDYDAKTPLDVKEEARTLADAPNATATHITFAGKNGARVTGMFARPKAAGVYPTVLILHGWTSNKDDSMKYFAPSLLAKGFAVLALDAPHHGERKVAGETLTLGPIFVNAMSDGLVDWRRGIDYLETRKDVDKARIGLFGYSMGSMMGSILGGVDKRPSVFALCVGGDVLTEFIASAPVEARPALFAVSPSLYIGHIAPRPILMLNGTQDVTVTAAASSRLYNAAGQPKQQVFFESGHILPPAATEKAVAWLVEKLKTDGKKKPETGKVALPGAGGVLVTGE